tara:strand:- start:203 stop:508 length:306 start_codon:yes stop_codon:yes gene_type:complete
MNEKIKEIIENEMDCLITDVDFVIKKEGSLQALVNMLEAAINYTRCSAELPSMEAANTEIVDSLGILKTMKNSPCKEANYDEAYVTGFANCYNWIRDKAIT